MKKFVVYVPRITYDKFVIESNSSTEAMDLAIRGKIPEAEIDCGEMGVISSPVLCYNFNETKLVANMANELDY